jgi:hypothetical protein
MLNQKPDPTEQMNLADGKEISSLCQMQRIIGESRSSEPDANLLLKSAGLPEIAGYLAFSYTLNVDADHFPEHDLGQLLLVALHSTVLNRDVKDIDITSLHEELFLNRHGRLTEDEFEKVSYFIEVKVLPLIIEQNYQSLAAAMIDCVIEPYAAFDEPYKTLLRQYIHRTANYGELRYQYHKIQHDILHLKMKGERGEQAANPSLDAIIQELRGNWRAEHPTKFEQLLNAFKERDFEPMETEEIAQLLFSNSAEPERAVQMKISILNSKLEKYGLRIERFSSYEMRKIREEKP